MKFSDVQSGQHFRYRGKNYLKLTPLMAVAEGEPNQTLIARSATVEVLDKVQAETSPSDPLPRKQVNQVMQALSTSVNRIIHESGLNAEQTNSLQKQIQTAFNECYQRLS